MSVTMILLIGVIIESAALIFELTRHGKRSYAAAIESENERLRYENRKLLDRVLHVTTGAPLELSQSTDSDSTAPTGPSLKSQVSAIAKAAEEELPHFPTFAELLANTESKSFREDAQLEPETQVSAINRSQEEMTEEQELQVSSLKRQFAKDFMRAKEEYLGQTAPIYTTQEKREQAN